MFLQLSVILFTGGIWQTPPKQTPPRGKPPSPGGQNPLPTPRRRPLQWTVRILLECILFCIIILLCIGPNIGDKLNFITYSPTLR